MRNLVLILILILAQVLICNHIMLFGVAMPIIFIYGIFRLPISLNPKTVLTIAFISGFLIDILSDTPGLNSLAATVVAALRRPIYGAYTGGDDSLQHLTPSISTLPPAIYIKYLITLTLIYCTLVFFIEYFSFTAVGAIIVKIIASTLLSSVVMLGIDGLMRASRS
ncbi:MAG: rod shape-determining protein MreD [Bacteroidales bacterium]|nr:rod shape-determining protein MreD [Bacteroidales bacterium]